MLKQLIDQPRLRAARPRQPRESSSYGGAPMPFPVIRRAIERFPKTVGLRERLRPDRDDVDAHRARPRRSPARRRRRRRSSATLRRLRVDRPAAARRRGADRRRRRADARRRRGRRDLRPHAARHEGLRGRAKRRRRSRADGWLPTRDMGWVDGDGYLFLAGRKDDMIIRGGENIAPAEVEAVLYVASGGRRGRGGRRARRRVGPARRRRSSCCARARRRPPRS